MSFRLSKCQHSLQKTQLANLHTLVDLSKYFNNGCITCSDIKKSEKHFHGLSLLPCRTICGNDGTWSELLNELNMLMIRVTDVNDLRKYRLYLHLDKNQIIIDPYAIKNDNRNHSTIYHNKFQNIQLIQSRDNNTHIICKPEKTHDIGIDNRYDWIPCKSYLRLKASAEPSWRTKNDIEKEIFAILEVLYYYINTKKMSIEEECEYTDIICDVMKYSKILEIKSLDIEDYLEPAIEVYIGLLKSFSIGITFDSYFYFLKHYLEQFAFIIFVRFEKGRRRYDRATNH